MSTRNLTIRLEKLKFFFYEILKLENNLLIRSKKVDELRKIIRI